MSSKRKYSKTGTVAPLRKSYLYWLAVGLMILGGTRGKDLWLLIGKLPAHSKQAPLAAGAQTAGADDRSSTRALLRAVDCLSQVSLNATNQLTVVRYLIASTQNSKINAEQQLAWLPRVVAIYRDGLQDWRARTDQGKDYREQAVVATGQGDFGVEYLDDHTVLLCPIKKPGQRITPVALPVSRIETFNGARCLLVEKQRVYTGDHIYFAGLDFEIRMIASDRFEMAANSRGVAEERVLMYQFVF